MRIAVLLTCFNRKEKTLKCLSSLYTVIPSCEVYLVDDASTDGTSKDIRRLYPTIQLIQGSGDLFWNRGMYTAWDAAIKSGNNYDFYLWLNDDVELCPYFLEELLECYRFGKENCIVSGLIREKGKSTILYGGSDVQKKKIQEAIFPQEIVFMNGNVVLVPKHIVEIIGILDPRFHHDLGDVDYGLTAQKHGYKVFSTRKAIGKGYANNICRVRKWGTSIENRFKSLFSPLGSPPSINYYFRRKHFGIINATSYFIYLYFINLLPDFIVDSIWTGRYNK